MKRLFQMIVLLSGIVSVQFLIGCNDDDNDPPSLCVEPPCGTLNPNATNLTILIRNDLNIGNVGIVVDESEQELSLNGRDISNDQPYTCWQTIPTINSSSEVILIYEFGEEVIIGALNVSNLNSNQLVIAIDGEAASITDYQECIDVI